MYTQAKTPFSLLGNIPNPLTIFQIGCATFRRLFVIFRCSGCPADIRIACTRQQYGILFRDYRENQLGEIVLSLYIGYGSSISRHYFFNIEKFFVVCNLSANHMERNQRIILIRWFNRISFSITTVQILFWGASICEVINPPNNTLAGMVSSAMRLRVFQHPVSDQIGHLPKIRFDFLWIH